MKEETIQRGNELLEKKSRVENKLRDLEFKEGNSPQLQQFILSVSNGVSLFRINRHADEKLFQLLERIIIADLKNQLSKIQTELFLLQDESLSEIPSTDT